MAKQLRPIPSDGLSVERANVIMSDVGTNEFTDIGDVEGISISLSFEEIERYGKNFGTKQLRRSDITGINMALSMETVDMTRFMRTLAVGAKEGSYATQTAATSEVFTITSVKAGKVYKLPHRNLSAVTVDDGTGMVPYAVGVNVVILEESGYIQVLSVPTGADADVTVTYDAPAIGEVDDIMQVGIGSNFNIRKTLHIIGINDIGPRDLLVVHDVQLRPEGDRGLVGGDDYSSLSITGRVFADPSQEKGLELGYLTEIAPK